MKLNEIFTGPYVVFVDMDGVIVNFLRGMKSVFPEYNEEQYQSDKNHKKEAWTAVKRYEQEGGRFWFDLKPMADANLLWKYTKHLHPEILTATGSSGSGVGIQKKDWVAANLGDGISVHAVSAFKDKAKFAKPGHILIDDMRESIDPWIAAGGIGILHTSAANTIAQLKKIGI